MTIVQLIFYSCSVMLIGSAVMVISSKNSVKSVMFLILTFFYAACIWMLLESEFLAILLVLVYVGAVMVLFLFVVMMLDIDFAAMRQGFTRYLPLGLLIAAALLYALFRVLGSEAFGPGAFSIPDARPADYSSVTELGMLLYTTYFYPFEIAALILMVAMIAAISLAFRGKRKGSKSQVVSEQVLVKKADRLRVVKMQSVKPPSNQAASDSQISEGADQ
ncbi:MAG: NADH:ubiquinone oxidoreductase subunit J [Gammaproteobacteria bacterium]|nr:MAG: NADH:ubiquinone oxidoreductase subunit J [Gammaproteobacteria bacterium]